MPLPASDSKKIEIYTQESAVNWLAPAQLLQTGIEALVAGTIGRFADSREVQGALHPAGTQPPLAVADKNEVWVDYAADTGDGWNATCSVAWCLSRATLDVGAHTLPRADVLVLGGDQVYPTPAENAYRSRFIDPFRAAFPEQIVPDKKDAPLLLAIPGNHDWYDGLRGFKSLFCRQAPIGSWRTQQATSYFALQLPHGWWLWGLDLQLDADIDQPQFEYFKKQAALLDPNDKVILCAPEPSWITEGQRLEDLREAEASILKLGILSKYSDSIELQTSRFRSLRNVEALLSARKVRLAAVLAGDLHHYARYVPSPGVPQPENAPPRITCGGGGAYLLGTDALPDALDFYAQNGEQNLYQIQTTYPTKNESKSLRNRAWLLPVRNFKFTSLLALVYLLYLWVLQNASRLPLEALGQHTLSEYLTNDATTFDQVLQALLHLLASSPASAVFTLAIIAALTAFTRSGVSKKRKRLAIVGGIVHALMHLCLAILLLKIMVCITSHFPITATWPLASVFGMIPPAIYSALTGFVLGGLMGGLLFGIWLVLGNRLFGWYGEEVFSCQSIADYKSFLRMKITPQGLTIYPLKIANVCRSWRVGDGIQVRLRAANRFKLEIDAQSRERFVPEQEIQVELIESPIVIATPAKT